MAEDRDKDAPSLEPPSLFGRKKKAPGKPPERAAEQPPATESAPATSAVAAPVATEAAELAQIPPAAPTPERAPADEPTQVAPAADETPTTIFDDTSEPTPDVAPAVPPEVAPAVTGVDGPKPPRQPWLEGRPAAMLTGLLVGALIVATTAGSFHICSAVKGTSSCGDSGFFLLLAILVVSVVVGATMLKAAAVPEATSTSFLAVGLLSVVTLLFLVGSIFQWWMIIVIPVVAVATFVLSHWVTTTYIDPAGDGSDAAPRREEHDVR